MATISPITLTVTVNVGNADVKVKYDLTGSAFDIASGQPYIESCNLIGDDTGIVPAEDGTDDSIPNGTVHSGKVVFPNETPISRTWTKTFAKSSLNEDTDTDEIRALVKLTPVLAKTATRESSKVVASY
jgi:hypothetical protein